MISTDSTEATCEHIARVRSLLEEIQANLFSRGRFHDQSKLEEPEKSGFDRLMGLALSDLKYGSDEYREALKKEKPAIAHHYLHNSHHPEHYAGGVAGMSLLDVIEMLADWKAAGERMKPDPILDANPGERLRRSIDYNAERFKLSDQLKSILHNTAHELCW